MWTFCFHHVGEQANDLSHHPNTHHEPPGLVPHDTNPLRGSNILLSFKKYELCKNLKFCQKYNLKWKEFFISSVLEKLGWIYIKIAWAGNKNEQDIFIFLSRNWLFEFGASLLNWLLTSFKTL